MKQVRVVVEGLSDLGAAKAILRVCDLDATGSIHVTNGCRNLDSRIANYRRAKIGMPWVVFRDADGKCPVELRRRLEDNQPFEMTFQLRVVVNEIESWLMGDMESFSCYFDVPIQLLSHQPESLEDPKAELLKICKKSRKSEVRQGVTASFRDSNLRAGPEYVRYLNDFAASKWRPEIAALQCPSLERAIRALKQLSMSDANSHFGM